MTTRKKTRKRSKPAAVTPAGFSKWPVTCPAGHQFAGDTFAVDGLDGGYCADHAEAASRGEEPRVPSLEERVADGLRLNNGGFENRTASAARESIRMAGHNSGGIEQRIQQHI